MLETLVTVLLWVLAIISGIILSPFIFVAGIILSVAIFIVMLATLFSVFFICAMIFKIIVLPFELLSDYLSKRKAANVAAIKKMYNVGSQSKENK